MSERSRAFEVGPVRSVMNRMNFVCCATNHSQESANSPQSFCPFIRVNMAEEELTRCVVDNDSGKCKARSAGEEAPFVVNVSAKADFASDDAPVAVPSFASDDVRVAVDFSFHAQASQVRGQCV